MTREEIIQGLQFTIDMFLSDPLTGEPITKPRNDMDKTTIDACKGAIELLTQESCEDAISREDALMCMTGEYIADMTYKPEDIISKHIQRLRALPPVQPKPKTGHWIFDEILDRNYYCSACKSMGVDYWDYCPYCGARMVEPQESEVQDERG